MANYSQIITAPLKNDAYFSDPDLFSGAAACISHSIKGMHIYSNNMETVLKASF